MVLDGHWGASSCPRGKLIYHTAALALLGLWALALTVQLILLYFSFFSFIYFSFQLSSRGKFGVCSAAMPSGLL